MWPCVEERRKVEENEEKERKAGWCNLQPAVKVPSCSAAALQT